LNWLVQAEHLAEQELMHANGIPPLLQDRHVQQGEAVEALGRVEVRERWHGDVDHNPTLNECLG
jgi:hypothetical protein